jgi:ATP-dependent Lon protease
VKRQIVAEVMTAHDLSQRRACGLIGITRRGLKRAPVEDRNVVTSIASVDDPAYLADKLLSHLGIKLEDKQSLLECTNPAERLERILGYMRSELEILEVEKRIRSRVKNQIEMTQKEYYLDEQMRAIQKELGEKDEFKFSKLQAEGSQWPVHLSFLESSKSHSLARHFRLD